MARIVVAGAGGWGTALALMAHQYGHDVALWSPFEEEIGRIRRDQEHKKLLPGVPVPETVELTTDLSRARGADLVIMAGGSDAPVESFNPWMGIYAAVTRQDMDGYPVGGYHPDEKISVYDAVCMYSKNVAYANGSQDLMGTIEAGKFADMVVIDRDIFHIPENDIKDIQVLNTYMAGIERYHRD